MEELVSRLRTWTHGLVSVAVTGADDPVEPWLTRALMRVRRGGGGRALLRELFGERWVAGGDLGFVRGVP